MFNRSICDFNKLHKTETQNLITLKRASSTIAFHTQKLRYHKNWASIDHQQFSIRKFTAKHNYTRNPRFAFTFSICLVSGCRVEPCGKLSCCGENKHCRTFETGNRKNREPNMANKTQHEIHRVPRNRNWKIKSKKMFFLSIKCYCKNVHEFFCCWIFYFFEIKRAIIAGSVAPGGSISIIFQRLYSVYTVTTIPYTLGKNNERAKLVIFYKVRQNLGILVWMWIKCSVIK